MKGLILGTVFGAVMTAYGVPKLTELDAKSNLQAAGYFEVQLQPEKPNPCAEKGLYGFNFVAKQALQAKASVAGIEIATPSITRNVSGTICRPLSWGGEPQIKAK